MIERVICVQVQTAAENTSALKELGVFHVQVAFLRNAVLCTLNDILFSSEHRQTDLVADEV